MKTARQAGTDSWWGEFAIGPGDAGRWQVGNLDIQVGRLSHEWQLWVRELEVAGEHETWAVTLDGSMPEMDQEPIRFAFARTVDSLRVMPAVADRSVVARPRGPLVVPPDQAVTVFLCSPAWLQIHVAGLDEPLFEAPTVRLSETWFGPSKMEGDLAYALTTQARLSVENLPLRPHRIITSVVVRNTAPEALALERLHLPIPALPLYVSRQGILWTADLAMEREEVGEVAAVEIRRGPPGAADGAILLQEPRHRSEQLTAFRAFDGLLARFSE